MGKIKQGILGGFSGKVGNVIGTSWKGISVVKVMPQSVANPKTAKQLDQRSSLSSVVAFSTMILASFIKPLWDRFAQGMSGYNEFISKNIALFTDVMPSDFSRLVASKGKLDELADLTCTCSTGGQINPRWDKTVLGTYGQLTDEIYLLIVNETTGAVNGNRLGNVTRNDNTVSTSLPGTEFVTGNELHMYFSVRRADGTMVSNSQYLNVTVG